MTLDNESIFAQSTSEDLEETCERCDLLIYPQVEIRSIRNSIQRCVPQRRNVIHNKCDETENSEIEHALADLTELVSLMDDLILRTQLSDAHALRDDSDLKQSYLTLRGRMSSRLRAGTSCGTARRRTQVEMLFYVPAIRSAMDRWHITSSMRCSQISTALLWPRSCLLQAISQINALPRRSTD